MGVPSSQKRRDIATTEKSILCSKIVGDTQGGGNEDGIQFVLLHGPYYAAFTAKVDLLFHHILVLGAVQIYVFLLCSQVLPNISLGVTLSWQCLRELNDAFCGVNVARIWL